MLQAVLLTSWIGEAPRQLSGHAEGQLRNRQQVRQCDTGIASKVSKRS